MCGPWLFEREVYVELGEGYLSGWEPGTAGPVWSRERPLNYNLELLTEVWLELGKRSTVTQLSENFTQGIKCQLPRGTVQGARHFRSEF